MDVVIDFKIINKIFSIHSSLAFKGRGQLLQSLGKRQDTSGTGHQLTIKDASFDFVIMLLENEMQIKNPIKLDTLLIVEATNILSQSMERTINHGALQFIIVLLQQHYTDVPQSGF